MRLREGDRLLIRLPAWLGDAVMAEPAVSALAERVGPRCVTLAGPLPLAELLARGLPGARVAPAGELQRRGEHDVAVLFTNSFRSALAAWRAGIPVRAGWAREGRGPLLTHALRPPREVGRTPLTLGRAGRWPRWLPRPFGTACSELAAALGVPVRRPRPRLCLAASDQEQRLRRWSEAVPGADRGLPPDYVLVNVGARPASAKGYPPAAWARVVNRLLAAGQRVVLAAGPGEEALLSAVRAELAPGALCLADPVADLGELAAWIAGARLVLTADGGPRHLAVAFDRPLLVVLGPTDPRHTADWLEHTELVRVPVPCGPCHRERCPLPPGPEQHACMRLIAPDALARLALERMGA